MIKLKESYGDLSDYLEGHLDSWYGRLSELQSDIEDLGLDVDEINNEYVIVHAAEPDGEDVYCKIWLGGTPRTISLETFEMLESVRRPRNSLRESDNKITENKMIITVGSSLNADGFDIMIVDKDLKKLFKNSYHYGYNASWKQSWADSDKPYVTDIIKDLCDRYDVTRDNIEVTSGKNVFTGSDMSDKAVSSFIKNYIEEIEYKIDPYDECLEEANVVGMGGGYPNVYLPKAAKEYLKRKGFQEVDTEIGPCFYMRFPGNEVWEIYIDEQYGGIYVVQEGYELKPTDDIATIDDYDYKDDIDAVINLGNCLSNGEDFDSCLKAFFK